MPKHWLTLLAIFVGGGLGSLARYGIGGLVQNRLIPGSLFPWGTLAVNVTGCLAAGLLAGLLDWSVLKPEWRMLVFIGILGGYTTFSTYGLETAMMIRDREWWPAVGNVLASNVAGLAAFLAAYGAIRWATGR